MIELNNISKSYGDLEVLKNLSFNFRAGEFVGICGPSGIGKTTLLQLIAGLEQPDGGSIYYQSRNIAYVFQESRLIPWCNVLENIEIGLFAAMPGGKSPRRQIAGQLALQVGLDGFQHYYPSQLSGGMKQRVSLARAFAIDPDILLLDEPFSSLNDDLRDVMCHYLTDLLAAKPRTSIMVTHNIDEAVRLADRIIFLHKRPCEIVLDHAINTALPERNWKFRMEQIELIQTLTMTE
jgi:NitT/TauT family transport system ATP-binding protein